MQGRNKIFSNYFFYKILGKSSHILNIALIFASNYNLNSYVTSSGNL